MRNFGYASMLFSLLTFSCGSNITPMTPTCFGVWSNGCTRIAIAVNRQDWDGGLFMNHETNMRSDLHLCDTAGGLIKTVFSERTVDGNPALVDTIAFSDDDVYVYVYSTVYGTGKVQVEKINVAAGSIDSAGQMETSYLFSYVRSDHNTCNAKRTRWNSTTNWVELYTP